MRTVSWSFPLYLLLINLFVPAHRPRRALVVPGGGRAGGQLHPAAAAALRQPAHVHRGVPRRLLRGHRHDRARLARAVQDDHQRSDPPHPPAPAQHGGHLLDHPLLHPAGHAGGGGAGPPVGAAGAQPVPAGGDGAAVVRGGEPVRARHSPRAVLAARQPAGRLRGDLGRILRVVLHPHHPGAGKEGVLPATFLVDGPFGFGIFCGPPRSSA